MKIVIEEVRNAFGGGRFLIAYAICLAIVIILSKEKRKPFAFPAILMMLAILNPILYAFCAKLKEAMVYWRTLWMLPILPVCAAAIALIVDIFNDKRWKIITIVAGCSIIIVCGGFVYTNAYPPNSFVASENPDKLPNAVLDIGDALCEIEEEPYAVADSSLSIYLRQYSGKIHLPYARSVVYGNPSQIGREMNAALVNGNYSVLAQMMANYDYEYLVTDNSGDKDIRLREVGFEPLRQAGNYGIYRNHYPRTEKRVYNELHQVISVTFVNENGEAMNGPGGYATVYYEYDKSGRVVFEFRRDSTGNAVPDRSGRAGYRREYNYLGQVITDTNLDVEGKPLVASFATRKCEYNRKHQLIKESYFDENNQLMIREDVGYAMIEYVRDSFGNIIEEKTFNANDALAPRNEGYSVVRRVFDDNRRVLSESYYDEVGNPINTQAGYQRFVNEYNSKGQLSLTWYYDIHGDRVECGSAYFHEYLQSLKRQDQIIFISVKDDGTKALTDTLLDDLKKIGIQTNLIDKYRYSYYAVITAKDVKEELSADHELTYKDQVENVEFVINSAGYMLGNSSSIQINGTEYSKNERGINIAIYNLKEHKVIQSISFDTCSREMRVTR